jgi:hypothetical protein
MDKPAEPVDSLNGVSGLEPRHGRVGDWYLEVDPAVRALAVVVLDKLPQYAVGMALTADENPVQALGSCCPDKPLGERVRPGRPDGCLDDPGADRSHHLVERPDELRIAVTDKEADISSLVLEVGNQVPGLLGDPRPNGVGCHAGQENLTPLDLDEEQVKGTEIWI